VTARDALCVRIGETARVLRESMIRGDALETATRLLPEALDAARGERLEEARAILSKLEEVRL
jgi:hypothetical protein